MDIGSGITDWDDGMMSLGKQTAVGAVTQGIGSKYDKFKSDSFLASTGAAGIKTASTNIATTAINSFDLNSGGLYFNTNSFENNWKRDLYGKGAVSGYISSMGTAGLNSTLTGFYGGDLKNGKALSSSIAGSAASIYEYERLGSTKLNVLNTTDLLSLFGADNLIGDYGGAGLIELGIGDGGSLFEFGTGGQNVSTSQIASAYQGINTYYQNAKISLSQKENIAEAKVAMRALYSRGGTDEEAMKLYTNLLSGKDNLKVGSTGGETAETTLNNNGGRTIRVASTGNNMMSRLRLGTVLGHEAHRDGEDSGQEVQESETVKAVYNHTGMALDMENDYSGLIASDKSLLKDVIRLGSTQNLNDYSESVLTDYDSTKDYWKVIKHIDGSITMVDDSSDDVTLVDEESGAEEVFKYTGGSKTGFIAESIGITRDEVNQQMGPGAGWSYVEGKWENMLNDKTVRFTPEQTEKIKLKYGDPVITNEKGFEKHVVVCETKSKIKSIFNKFKEIISPNNDIVNIGSLNERETEIFIDHMANFTPEDVLKYKYGENNGKPYDCADTYLQAYMEAYAIATGNTEIWKQFKHDGKSLDKLINIQAKDFLNPENTYFFRKPVDGKPTEKMDYLDGVVDNLFNSPNLKRGMAAVFSLRDGIESPASGHIAILQDFKRDKNGNIESIKLLEGHMFDSPKPVIIRSQDELNKYKNYFIFNGWAYPNF